MQRVIASEVDADSFFNFFKTINLEDKEVIEKLDQAEVTPKYLHIRSIKLLSAWILIMILRE